MCEPISWSSLAMAAVSAGVSAAATGASAYMQKSQMDAQNAANDQWRKYQENARREEQARQEAQRQKADAARTDTLGQMTPEAQLEAQAAEEGRLKSAYAEGTNYNNADTNAALLSGQQNGGESFKADYAARLSKASVDARKRIEALARINSFGGSFGGLGNRNAETIGAGDTAINLANNIRQGSLTTYGLQKSVNPVQLPGGTDYFSGIASAAAGFAGKAAGNHFAKV